MDGGMARSYEPNTPGSWYGDPYREAGRSGMGGESHMEGIYGTTSEHRMNVGQNERLISLIGGAALVLRALAKPSRASLLQLVTGGYLLYRGGTGYCVFYDILGIERTGAGGRAGIRVDHAMTVNHPREEVYRFWRNFENLPSFMKHLEEVRVTGERTSHWKAQAPLGMEVEWDAEILNEKENEYISWRSLPGSRVENSGVVRFKDAPGGRGTEVHVLLLYNPPLGSAAAAFARMFGEEPEVQIREDLRRFKQVMEAGETANTYGQTSGRAEEVDEQRGEIARRRARDIVDFTSEASFPASDAPAWTTGSKEPGEG